MTEPTPDLETIQAETWALLAQGTRRHKAPLHTLVLATATERGPSQRVVVLRRADAATRTVGCHADLRSPKVAEIRANPRVSWLGYHAETKIQLRLWGSATVRSDDAAISDVWAALDPLAQRSYCGSAPTTPQPEPASGLPPALVDRQPTPEESTVGRHNFGVITCEVDEFEWLRLEFRGHTRARFVWQQGAWHGTWLTP